MGVSLVCGQGIAVVTGKGIPSGNCKIVVLNRVEVALAVKGQGLEEVIAGGVQIGTTFVERGQLGAGQVVFVIDHGLQVDLAAVQPNDGGFVMEAQAAAERESLREAGERRGQVIVLHMQVAFAIQGAHHAHVVIDLAAEVRGLAVAGQRDRVFALVVEDNAPGIEAKGHALEVREGRLNAPHLLRDAESDFIVQVRISGVSGTDNGFCRAGLFLRGGENDPVVTFGVAGAGARPRCNVLVEVSRKGGGPAFRAGTYEGPPVGGRAWLRLERRGRVGTIAFSEDGRKWTPIRSPVVIRLPPKGKVGVVAESTADGDFKPVFDQFKLSLIKPAK